MSSQKLDGIKDSGEKKVGPLLYDLTCRRFVKYQLASQCYGCSDLHICHKETDSSLIRAFNYRVWQWRMLALVSIILVSAYSLVLGLLWAGSAMNPYYMLSFTTNDHGEFWPEIALIIGVPLTLAYFLRRANK